MTWKDLEEMYHHLKDIGECHTQKEFAEIIGQSPENVSKKLGTLNPVMPKTVYKLKDKYSHIFNESWLMNGEGEMINQSKSESQTSKDAAIDNSLDKLLSIIEKLVAKNEKLEAERETFVKAIENLTSEVASMRLAIQQMAAGHPVQIYQVETGDVNPAALNDKQKEYK